MYEALNLETRCNDDGGSLRGSFTLAYQLTVATLTQVPTPIKLFTSYLLELMSTRYIVATTLVYKALANQVSNYHMAERHLAREHYIALG